MTDYNTMLTLLQEMSTGKLLHNGCQACRHEDNCDIYGCAILREAIATMEQLYKDCWGHCAACVQKERSCNDEPCLSCDFIRRENWQWRGVQEQKKGANHET
ncbi:MAG: hypothetical protein LIO70_06895 [Clostridiales bacterium]|nr:hypothetical protein [Clostridiales bacterium]